MTNRRSPIRAAALALCAALSACAAPTAEPKAVRKTNALVPDDPILIRADKWTEWHDVGKFLSQCREPHAAFWKLELERNDADKGAKSIRGAKQR